MYEKCFEQAMTTGAPIPFVLPQWIACAPFEEYLDMTILEAREGKALLTMPFKVKHAQGMGLMHGGAVTALADTAVAMAIKSQLPVGTHFVTIDLNLKFHAPVTGGEVRAEARTEWRDERTIEGVADVFCGDIKVATFTSIFRVKQQKKG